MKYFSEMKFDTENPPEIVEILKVGKVPDRDLEITKDMLENIVKAFNDNATGYKVAIHPTHDHSLGAVGYVKELFIEGDILKAKVDWTPVGVQLYKEKRFPYFSVVLAKNYKSANGKTYPVVLVSADLTTTPAVKGLSAMFSEQSKTVPNDSETVSPDSETITTDSETGQTEKEGLVEDREALRKKAQQRAKKWGIAVRKDGHLTPPSEYGDVPYADPVNYRYPIDTPEHARAALNYISKEKNYRFYVGKGLKVVVERIVRACLKFGVTVKYNPTIMKGLPESLKKRLEGYEKMEELEEKIKALEKELKEKERMLEKRDIEAEVDKLLFDEEKQEGYIPPKDRDKVVEFLLSLDKDKREEFIELIKSRPVIKFNQTNPETVPQTKEEREELADEEEIKAILEKIEGGK